MSRKLLDWTAQKAWFALGVVALLLGLIGALLPLLPTTPFVILAAFSFSKSSPRFESVLVRNAIFGPIIVDWREKGAIAPRYKALAVGMMVTVFGVSLAMSVPGWLLAVQGVALGLAPTSWPPARGARR